MIRRTFQGGAARAVGLSVLLVTAGGAAAAVAQRAGVFGASRNHEAIAYDTAPVNTVVSELNGRIARGEVRLAFDPVSGYLRSVLEALEIPIESQVLVYSETSFQARLINRRNPRAVFFNDRAAVGWVRGGEVLEVSAQDPRQGTVYYTIDQAPAPGDQPAAQLTRNTACLACHLSWETLAVPGPFVLSTLPRRSDNDYANGFHADHRAPFGERWGGWYVTGARVPSVQMGNVELLQPKMATSGARPVPARASVEGLFDLSGYPTAHSDVVALMVLEHQSHATNLITRAGWEFRVSGMSPRVDEAVSDLVDYFLFVDEAVLPAPIRGTSGFAERFAAAGRRDRKGRSLRELQLDRRLMRYPCSYMIESPGFAGLPTEVRQAVFRRMAEVLRAAPGAGKYRHLTAADRTAILEIVSDLVPGSAAAPGDGTSAFPDRGKN